MGTDNLFKKRDLLREKKKTYRDKYSAQRNEVKISKKKRGKGKGNIRPTIPSKRKCGLCRVEGHDKRKCPQNKENNQPNQTKVHSYS